MLCEESLEPANTNFVRLHGTAAEVNNRPLSDEPTIIAQDEPQTSELQLVRVARSAACWEAIQNEGMANIRHGGNSSTRSCENCCRGASIDVAARAILLAVQIVALFASPLPHPVRLHRRIGKF